MTLPAFYTPEEAAERLKVTRRSVYAWLLSGRLKASKAGDTWRIAEPDLIEFMKTRKADRVTFGPEHPDYERWVRYFRRAGLSPNEGRAKAKGRKAK
jgi:excisionase family DNA binding protein